MSDLLDIHKAILVACPDDRIVREPRRRFVPPDWPPARGRRRWRSGSFPTQRRRPAPGSLIVSFCVLSQRKSRTPTRPGETGRVDIRRQLRSIAGSFVSRLRS